MPKPSPLRPVHCRLASFSRTVPSRLIALLLPALLLGGCHAAIWAQFAVLAISVGIFVGTVSLDQPGRPGPPEKGSTEPGWSQPPQGR